MRVRFQADADLNHIIIKATLRYEPSIDFQTAHVANLAGVEDPEVLAVAAQAGRTLVTHDRKTMPKHFAEFIGHTSSRRADRDSAKAADPCRSGGSSPHLDGK